MYIYNLKVMECRVPFLKHEEIYDNISFFVIVQACPEFPVTNGRISGLGRVKGSIVRIICKKGYKLVQSILEFRACGDQGQWTGGNHVKLLCKGKQDHT